MLFLLKSDIPLSSALLFSLLGFTIVFVMLVFLWIVIAIVSKVVKALESKKAAAAPVEAPAAAPAAAVVDEKKAPGSAGEIKLHDVPDKTAAMLMAIVANKLGKPLNELRFISIKEVK